MSGAGGLYQELILDHGRKPRNFRVLEGAARHAVGHNPLCGDRVTVYVRVVDGVVVDASFEGQGCAISQASSSLMTEAVKGKPVADALALFGRFHDLVTGHGPGARTESQTSTGPGEGDAEDDLDDDPARLGKLRAFSGVAEFPMRVKCATLAWHTLEAAIKGATDDAPVSTE